MTIPQTQSAVQLIGPDQLILNESKEVFRPGPHQILCLVEAVGLCFSDLKLLKQFSSHVRKVALVSGIDPQILREIPSYVPDNAPTVPGHETVVRIALVGQDVEDFKPGQRFLVQTDYRWLKTPTTNGAFGYNFEGALQQYVLMDLRVITSPEGESMLLPVSDELAGSAIALVEPWACVEDAYVSAERTAIKQNGKMLIVADIEPNPQALLRLFDKYGSPAQITWLCESPPPAAIGIEINCTHDLSALDDAAFDDIIYFGANPQTVETIFTKLALKGLLNIVQSGRKFDRKIVAMIGKVHYGGIRIVGTTGSDPAESMEIIPRNDEIRPGDKINVVGAGGPMGMMHVIRNICQGVENVSVFASDVDDNRLAALTKIAAPQAEKNNVEYHTFNAATQTAPHPFDYTAIMAPIPDLVEAAVANAAQNGLINIFAGIPATVAGQIDLDAYIEKRLYFIGTSGSTLDDMKRMLEKTKNRILDTNLSVAAISGLDGAVEGIRAVENRTIAGKIIVYPQCKGLGLITLRDLEDKLTAVAEKLNDGLWTNQAEKTLLEAYET
ncbi:MAG: alcohol dehydrogenase catalytic domain-containing protein [Sedimentisphaerales bacterium]|nr:alcohol dehydrogenase catalytic domain-containing protein [Sedimentisphaerales bacterium]